MGIPARSRTVAAQRRTRAVQLAGLGYTYEQIAREVGYGNRGTAYRAVRDELERCSVEAVDDLRRIELDRLEALQAALWDRAIAGEVAAVNAVLRLIEAQIRLLGLDRDDSPQDEKDAAGVVISPEELQRWLEVATGPCRSLTAVPPTVACAGSPRPGGQAICCLREA